MWRAAAVSIGLVVLVSGCDVPPPERDPLFDRFAGRTVIYDLPEWAAKGQQPAIQSWAEDGTTIFDARRPLFGRSKGEWDIRHGQYCVRFGPREVDLRGRDYTCWNVEFSGEGRVTFVAPSKFWVFQQRVEGRFVK